MAIGAPFFAKWTVPIGLALLLLTGIGPVAGWRRPTAANLRGQLFWPAVAALVTGAAVTALRVPLWAAGICFALCAFVPRESCRSSSGERSCGTVLPALACRPRSRA